MNFINLRNVANQEINESFSGILRISPYKWDEILVDDPTPLLYSAEASDIGVDLSDSVGNYLNITFIPQAVETVVSGLDSSSANIINITQKVSNLYCVNSLNIATTLYINNKNKTKAPIQVINPKGILAFPIDAPEDTSYLNHNGKIDDTVPENASKQRINKIFDNLWHDDEIYTSDEYENYHVKVNGKKIYRLKPASEIAKIDEDGKAYYEEEASMVPELYKHDYVLGQYAGHTYKATDEDLDGGEDSKLTRIPGNIKATLLDNNAKITELSFVEIEKIIWSLLEGAIGGAYRSFEGRYKDLYPVGLREESVGTENNLYNALFTPPNTLQYNEEELEDKIRAKAPLVGLPIQSGIITYNAIPFRRYMFHTLRRYENIDSYPEVTVGDNNEELAVSDYITHSNASASSSFIHNLVSEYILCDGRRIKDMRSDADTITDYPSINKKSGNWANWKGIYSADTTCIYDAMAKSIENSTDEDSSNVLRTPRLFELNQYAPRYLRGLNWLRVAEYDKVLYEDDKEKIEHDSWPYNHNTMLIEPDGSFIVNDWYSDSASIRPEIKYNKVDGGFINNELKQRLPGTKEDDAANIAKNIHEVGVYYANYDYKLAYLYRHVHQLVVDSDLLQNQDALYKVASYYKGSSNVYISSDTAASIKTEWRDYVLLKEDAKMFLGSYAMRSIQDIEINDGNLIRSIQDLPIAYRGGSTSSMRTVKSSYKGARAKLGKCTGNYVKGEIYYNAEGGYQLGAFRSRNNGTAEGWRFLSSLPVTNKYGSYKNVGEYATAKYGDTEILIDDSLPKPPSINLIPLMKI